MSFAPRPTTRRIGALALGVAALTVLAGCAEPAIDELSVPDEVTEPGTTLSVGDTARVPGGVALPEGAEGLTAEEYAAGRMDAEVGFTVTDVAVQDAGWFADNVENPDRYTPYIPVLVSTVVSLPEGADEGATLPAAPGAYGVTTDGTEVSRMAADTYGPDAVALCWDESELPDDNTVAVGCDVLLVPVDEELESIAWNGQSRNVTDPQLEAAATAGTVAYVTDPILFTL